MNRSTLDFLGEILRHERGIWMAIKRYGEQHHDTELVEASNLKLTTITLTARQMNLEETKLSMVVNT